MGIFDSLKKKKVGTPKAPRKTETASAADHGHDHAHEQKASAPKKTRGPVRAGSRAHAVLLRPHLSEKTAMQETHGIYTFVVAKHATKIDVKQAVKDVYGVMPTDVRMVAVQGKYIRVGRVFGRRSDWKKAMVTVPQGKTLHIHEGV